MRQRFLTAATIVAGFGLSLAAGAFAGGSSGAAWVINEVRIGQPGPDIDEFIEIRGEPGASLDGLSYIVIGDDDAAFPPAQNGYVEFVLNLTGLTMPPSGYLVIARSTFTLGVPDVVVNLAFEDNGNVTHLLVRDFVGGVGSDVDTDDDGIIDVDSWSEILSSVAFVRDPEPDGFFDNFVYSDNLVGPDGSSVPSLAYLCPNLDEYRFGSVDPTVGDDTPGAANPFCSTDKRPLRISEIRIDQLGNDNDEYFELEGEPGTSLDGLTYLVIGDGAGGSGVIEVVLPLDGWSIPASGFFVGAEASFSLGTATAIFPGANPLNFENTDNLTHMLVRGFSGTNGQDLDTNDDGVLDETPWKEIIDDVGLVLSDAIPPVGTEWLYSSNLVGPDGAFVPGHVYRCSPNGEWKVGAFDPGVGVDTPGAVNFDCPDCGGGGSCFVVHVGSGCDLVDCCTLVCAVDPTCCLSAWDAECVGLANTQCLGTGPAPALTINEVRIGQDGVDSDEFFEIVGEPGTSLKGVSYIVLGDAASPFGVVESVTLLDGTMPKSGFLLVARSTFSIGIPTLIRNSISFEDGDTVTHLLVYNFTGSLGEDLDLDDNCALDATPWASTLDGVTLVGFDPNCSYASDSVGPDSVYSPGHAYRCTPEGDWIVGSFQTTAFDTPGGRNPACPGESPCGDPKAGSCFEPRGTPGCADGECCVAVCAVDPRCCEAAWDKLCVAGAELLCAVPSEPPAVRLSEVRTDETGTDVSEYFELVGDAGTSLNGLTYVVIGDGPAVLGSGVVEMALPLNGLSVPASGFFLAARPTFALSGTPDLVTTDIIFENSDNVTHLLVWEFTGALGQDLDTNDDGVLDVLPWTSIVDGVSLVVSAAIPPVGTEWVYHPTIVGPDGTFVPSHVKYCPTSDLWTLGTFNPATSDDSPGAANPDCRNATPCVGDLDGSGSVNAADLAILLGGWDGDGASDLNGNGVTDAADLAILLGSWGDCR